MCLWHSTAVAESQCTQTVSITPLQLSDRFPKLVALLASRNQCSIIRSITPLRKTENPILIETAFSQRESKTMHFLNQFAFLKSIPFQNSGPKREAKDQLDSSILKTATKPTSRRVRRFPLRPIFHHPIGGFPGAKSTEINHSKEPEIASRSPTVSVWPQKQ